MVLLSVLTVLNRFYPGPSIDLANNAGLIHEGAPEGLRAPTASTGNIYTISVEYARNPAAPVAVADSLKDFVHFNSLFGV